MKVLQVNCVYNKGSTGKIVHSLHKGFAINKISSVVCYGRGKIDKSPNVYKVCGEFYSHLNKLRSLVTGIMYGGCFFSTNKLISVIKKEKPDIVHLHCINGYFVNIFRLITWLKKNNIKTVLTLHAEFMYTGSCGIARECDKWRDGCGKCPRLKEEFGTIVDSTKKAWLKMKKAFEGFDNLIVTSVSPWLMERAKSSPILKDKIHIVVLNGLDTGVFKRYDDLLTRKQYGLTNEKIVFHATPKFTDNEDDLKGGRFIISLAEKFKDKNFKFLVAGNYDANVKVPSNVILLGRISNQQELAKLYSMANVTLLTSKRETFSMVCAESLSCGTPVVGFYAGGPEQIAIPQYSKFVEYGNVEQLFSAVNQMVEDGVDKNEISKTAHEKYAEEKMVEEYIKVYREFDR